MTATIRISFEDFKELVDVRTSLSIYESDSLVVTHDGPLQVMARKPDTKEAFPDRSVRMLYLGRFLGDALEKEKEARKLPDPVHRWALERGYINEDDTVKGAGLLQVIAVAKDFAKWLEEEKGK